MSCQHIVRFIKFSDVLMNSYSCHFAPFTRDSNVHGFAFPRPTPVLNNPSLWLKNDPKALEKRWLKVREGLKEINMNNNNNNNNNNKIKDYYI